MVCCADGTVRLYDLLYDRPIIVWKEHESEVYGIHNNFINKNLSISASYDASVKLWDLNY